MKQNLYITEQLQQAIKEGREIGWFNAFIADENSDRQLMIVSMVEDVQNKGGSHYVVNKVRNIF